MKRYLQIAGNAMFWLSWPLLYVYLRDTERTRVLVHSKDKILVVKDWLGDGSWKLPGGGITGGEDFAKSAVRELQEETGLSIKARDLRSLGPVESRSHGFNCRLHCYAVSVPSVLETHVKRWEIIAAEWLPLADLLHKERISDSTRVILKRWYHGEF